MISDYISINRILRSIVVRCHDGHGDPDGFNRGVIASYLKRDIRDLRRLWPADLDPDRLARLEARVEGATPQEYFALTDTDIPEIEEQIDRYFELQRPTDLESAVLGLLHPCIVTSSYGQLRAGHYRDAVFNAVLAVLQLLRDRTGLKSDGTALVDAAYGRNGKLAVAELGNDSGDSDQQGFHQLLRGAVLSIRNPKAHSLTDKLTTQQAVQYLAFLSILARRIDESHEIARPDV